MKLTKRQLQNLIQEELQNVLQEYSATSRFGLDYAAGQPPPPRRRGGRRRRPPAAKQPLGAPAPAESTSGWWRMTGEPEAPKKAPLGESTLAEGGGMFGDNREEQWRLIDQLVGETQHSDIERAEALRELADELEDRHHDEGAELGFGTYQDPGPEYREAHRLANMPSSEKRDPQHFGPAGGFLGATSTGPWEE